MNTEGSLEAVEDLIEQYLSIVESSRNQQNHLKWDTSFVWERDNWRAVPRQPFCINIEPDRPFLALLLGTDLKRFFQDCDTHLREWLRWRIFRFREFQDDTYFPPEFTPWWSSVTEISLFGVNLLFSSDKEPMPTAPILQEKPQLAEIQPPDFYHNGVMPLMHRQHDYAAEVLGDKLKVLFPTWARGPISTAMSLREMENLLLDILDDPSFVHQLMRFVVDCRKAWLIERARFLNQPIQRGLLFTDEVGSPLISPDQYREFILAYELELANFHNGIYYWHSCGNTTPYVSDIATIPGLELFHVGPFTDLAEVLQKTSPDIALEICLIEPRDIYEASETQQREKLVKIAQLCGDRPYYIRVDAFHICDNPMDELRKVQRWLEIAQEVREETGYHAA